MVLVSLKITVLGWEMKIFGSDPLLLTGSVYEKGYKNDKKSNLNSYCYVRFTNSIFGLAENEHFIKKTGMCLFISRDLCWCIKWGEYWK